MKIYANVFVVPIIRSSTSVICLFGLSAV